MVLLATVWPWLLLAVLALPIAYLVVYFLFPLPTIYGTFWCWFNSLYRIRIHGMENVPKEGAVLLVPNHISWIDGFLIQLVTHRHVRTMVYAANFASPLMSRLARQWKAILVDPNPKSIIRALKVAHEALLEGEAVCIFAEGGISRTGQVQAFKGGTLRVLRKTNAPVIPVYIDGLWGSMFSFSGGRFFWKWPRRWRYPVDVYFGKPMQDVQEMNQIRQSVVELGVDAMENRKQRFLNLPKATVAACKKRTFQKKVADSSGAELSGKNFLMRTLILRRLLLREVIAPDEKNVGLLLPPSVPAMAANLALTFDERVAVNLNYTVSSKIMNECIKQAEIKHVLTSRRVMEKLDLEIGAPGEESPLVYLEDLKDKATLGDKLICALMAYVLPSGIVSNMLKLDRIDSEDVLTIIFTSGSTGVPKGVMLTHANIASNVSAIDQVVQLNSEDVIMGVLPFFHSFGYTVTIWCVASLNIGGAYHFSPLDVRQIGKLTRKHKGTVLLATPTFLRSYLKRCSKEDFETLDIVVTGAEKLPTELCDMFEKKFGVRPVEGYGATETAPLVSINIPPSRSPNQPGQIDRKEGTVGRAVPGVTAKVINPETKEELGVGETGMLLVKGTNVMKGYLKRPEKTSEVVQDGWYVTGDVALIDEDGFIQITGRESRFSKIGGEMVPHIQIEEILQELIGDDDDDEGAPQIAVTAVPDPKKGEKLIVLHTNIPKPAAELIVGLKERGLPNIYIPAEDCFLKIDEIPILGTGKLDLKGLKETAMNHFGPKE